jgi:hypothetical protein
MGGLMSEKKEMIDYACGTLGVKSFADLGGVWGVEGGYTFYALEKYKIDKAFLVDEGITEIVQEKQRPFQQLTLIKDNFGRRDIPPLIGEVDAMFLFDVLLHQVSPDWNAVIEMYARYTHYFIIYNQQYKGQQTVRLLDLGEEEYFKNVPHSKAESHYKALMEKMDEIHPQHKRKYRDLHHYWQWGITDQDLVGVMKDQGFENIYYKNYGQWCGLINFEGHAFIFRKLP